MPPVVRFTMAFAAGLLVGRAPFLPWWALAATAAGACVLWRRHGVVALVLAAGTAGAAQGLVTAAGHASGCAATWSGRRAAIVRLADPPSRRGLAEASVLHAPEGCGGRIRLRLAHGALPGGATAVVVGRFAGGTLRVEHVRQLGGSVAARFAVRDAIARRIDRLYGARAPLIEALVIGRRGDLDPRLRAEFVSAGLAHLLAISGLHVGIVAGWIALAARACGLRRRVAWVSAAGVWLYAALLGFPAPATRAAAFVLVAAAARARERHPPWVAVLATAVLVVLGVDPGAASRPGAWLSVAAVWGTGHAAAFLGRRGRSAPVLGLVAASIGAVIATAPITAYVFGQVALAGVVTNLVAVPLAGVIVPAVLASLVLGGPMAAGAGLALAALERIAALGAALPFGTVAGEPGVGMALPWLAVVLVGRWLVVRRPAVPVIALRVSIGLAAASWIAAGRHWVVADRYDGLTIHVLSVGQGDAIALRSPHGRWALVDAGPRTGGSDAGRRVVAPFLRRQGVRQLDWLVVTHGDADHLGGVPAVLRAIPVERVLEPGQPLGTALYTEYLETVDAVGARWHAARRGDVLHWDGVRIEVLHPTDGWVRREARPNENSIVLRVSYGAFDALLTGDIGLPVESLLVGGLRQVELLKVGHHGSAGSSGTPWIAAAGPRVAVISVGVNRYGHPAPAVLSRLAAHGVPIFRTDRGGTVTVRTDGLYLAVHQGSPRPSFGRTACPRRDSSPSRASSSSRSGCFPRRPGNSPTFYTTWPSPPR